MILTGNIVDNRTHANGVVVRITFDLAAQAIIQVERLPNGDVVETVLRGAQATAAKNVAISGVTAGAVVQKMAKQIHDNRFGVTSTIAGNGIDDDIP